VGLAQMGVLEIHPWGARRDNPDRPDRLVFDLDPDPALPWGQVAATAMLLRSELGRLGLESWLKTTGGKGLHVVVPIDRRTDWPDARAFARAFVDSIVRIEPRMFTSNMRKGQRDGRIFIDYLRNSRGATAVAPYSTRAREWAPVSMPMTWEELERTSERPVFTVANALERLGDFPDPWVDIASVRQSITKQVRQRLEIAEPEQTP
jgi:bifunctional non-homologous end joining protein LigD